MSLIQILSGTSWIPESYQIQCKKQKLKLQTNPVELPHCFMQRSVTPGLMPLVSCDSSPQEGHLNFAVRPSA